MHAVRVEVHARPADRQREQQLAAGREHPLQLRRRLARAQRVERVAVAPEPDVLGHVQAADRLQRAVRERHVQHAAGDRRQALDVDLQRPDVDERDLGDRRQEAHEIHARADVDVPRRAPLGDPPRRPRVLVEVVRVERRGRQPVGELGERIAPAQPLGAGQLLVGGTVAQPLRGAARSGGRAQHAASGIADCRAEAHRRLGYGADGADADHGRCGLHRHRARRRATTGGARGHRPRPPAARSDRPGGGAARARRHGRRGRHPRPGGARPRAARRRGGGAPGGDRRRPGLRARPAARAGGQRRRVASRSPPRPPRRASSAS